MKTIEENNRLIADFMGMENERHEDGRYFYTNDYEEEKDTGTRFIDGLYFHLSWDWLMPVVEKCLKTEGSMGLHDDILHVLPIGGIEKTFNAVVEFIKWYNSQGKYMCICGSIPGEFFNSKVCESCESV
jgi:hypothetical protein